MKEIKAYIHNNRIADVIRALKESGLCNTDGTPGCRNLAVAPVKMLLKAMDAKEQHYSIELAEVVINESKLELVCEDHQVDELVGHRAHGPHRPGRGGVDLHDRYRQGRANQIRGQVMGLFERIQARVIVYETLQRPPRPPPFDGMAVNNLPVAS